MKFELDYIEEDKIVFVKASGELNVESEEELRNDVIEFTRKHNCLKVLIDYKELSKIDMEIFEIYEIPKKYVEQELSRDLKIAILFKVDEKEKFSFYETTAFNRGYKVKLFLELEDAKNWLKELN